MLGTNADIDFVLAEAGDTVTYGVQAPVKGVLDREPINELVGTDLKVIGQRIQLHIRQDALAALANDTAIAVAGANGGNFIIKDVGAVQADGLRILTLVEV